MSSIWIIAFVLCLQLSSEQFGGGLSVGEVGGFSGTTGLGGGVGGGAGIGTLGTAGTVGPVGTVGTGETVGVVRSMLGPGGNSSE